jgi:predicted transposase/invertase (TIGR01784 family)
MTGPNIVSPHDRFFHSVMEHRPVAIDFLNHHLPERIRQALDVESLRLLPTTYVDVKFQKSYSDVVFRCKLAEKTAYITILAEHQSTPDKFMPFRVTHYVLGLLNSLNRKHPGELLPAVYTLVFYHGEQTPYPYSLNLLDCFDDPLNVMKDTLFQPLPLIDVNQLSDEELLQQQWVGPVAMALKHIREADMTPYALRILDALTGWPEDDPETVELLKLLLNYVYVVGNIDDAEAFFEAGNNRTSGLVRSEMMTIAEKLREQGMKKGRMQGMQEGRERGMQEGREQGREQGIKEGERKGLEKTAMTMLQEGVEVAFIAKVTGLSVADIEQMQVSLEQQ